MDLWKYYDGNLKYPNVTKYSHEKELALTNPKWAIEYIEKNGKDEDLEKIIAKSARYSYEYAFEIKDGKFKLGEPAIAKDAFYAVNYARDVLNGDRFVLGEPTIAKNPEYATDYARFILNEPWEDAEPYIAKDASCAKDYTNNVLFKDFYIDDKLICKYDENESDFDLD